MTTNGASNAAIALPDEQKFIADIQAINRFQQIVRQNMRPGHDFGVIPGTSNKPTLLKPGAEKIAKLLGLSDTYEIVHCKEDWEHGFFRYLVKCRLVSISSGVVISEGLGECNSMESKYRWRWVFSSELGNDIDKDSLVTRTVRTRKGLAKQYRVQNDDIYSLVNTILKMAKKRALIDAALSSGRLSDVFTQDIEDMQDNGVAPVEDAIPSRPKAAPTEDEGDGSESEDDPEDTPQTQPQEKPQEALNNGIAWRKYYEGAARMGLKHRVYAVKALGVEKPAQATGRSLTLALQQAFDYAKLNGCEEVRNYTTFKEWQAAAA